VIGAADALRSAVIDLLAARGRKDLSALVARSHVEIVGPSERWSMSDREVLAQRVALTVSAADHVLLSASSERLAALRDAFAAAMRTPETELCDLSILLRLSPEGHAYHHVYRDVPERAEPSPPTAEAILAGAIALREAAGDKASASILQRAEIETSPVPFAGHLVRLVLRLDAGDLLRAERDPLLADWLRRSVRDAGTTASQGVAGVDLAVRAPASLPRPSGPEAELVRALEIAGAAVLPVAREAGRVLLAVAAGGELRLVEVVAGRGKAVARDRDRVTRFRVAAGAVADADGAAAVGAAIVGDVPVPSER
jgi:hypothetical protein